MGLEGGCIGVGAFGAPAQSLVNKHRLTELRFVILRSRDMPATWPINLSAGSGYTRYNCHVWDLMPENCVTKKRRPSPIVPALQVASPHPICADLVHVMAATSICLKALRPEKVNW